MHFPTLLTTTLLPLLALSAPSAAPVSMAAANTQWTILSARRACDAADNVCTWTFGISVGAGTASTACKYSTKRASASVPASQASGGPTDCGKYQVTSGWSGQFGPGNGFTTLSVVDTQERLIAWPAYSDADVAGGKVVSPDRSFAVQKLP